MTGRECIALLKEMKSIYFEFKKDKTHLLNTMKPTLWNLHNGKEVFKQTAEFIYADEFDKALKYVRKALRISRFWPLSKLRFSIFEVIIWYILGFLICGIVLFFIGSRLTRLGNESLNWPQTTGIITNSYFYDDTDYGDDDVGELSFIAVTEYSYTVYGKEYMSGRRSLGDIPGMTGFTDPKEADSVVKQYPESSLVTVWYRPDKHVFAVLEPGLESKFHFTIYIASLFLFVAFIMFSIPVIVTIVKIVRQGKK